MTVADVVEAYLIDNPNEEFSARQLADMFGCSPKAIDLAWQAKETIDKVKQGRLSFYKAKRVAAKRTEAIEAKAELVQITPKAEILVERICRFNISLELTESDVEELVRILDGYVLPGNLSTLYDALTIALGLE